MSLFRRDKKQYRERPATGVRFIIVALLAVIVLLPAITLIFNKFHFQGESAALETNVLKQERYALKEENKPLAMTLLSLKEKSPVPKTERREELSKNDVSLSKIKYEQKINQLKVEGIRFKKASEPDQFRVEFNLVKNEVNKKRISGYIILAGKTSNGHFTIPEGLKINQGTPSMFEKGESFSIRHGKQIKKTVPYPIDRVKTLNAFIYGKNGAILLKETIWEHEVII